MSVIRDIFGDLNKGNMVNVHVHYERKGGLHVFTCEELPDLYVEGEDLKETHSNVTQAIEDLLTLNGVSVERVTPVDTYEEFLERALH